MDEPRETADEPRKVEFDKLEDRVLPSGAGIAISSESISRLLAGIGDSAVLAVGSFDAFRNIPGLTLTGAAAAGLGIAAYGSRKLRENNTKPGDDKEGQAGETPDQPGNDS